LTGIVSMMTAIFLITTNHEEFDDLLANTIMRVFFILFGEIFFAFGFGAMIVGVRFTFNRRDWLAGVFSRFWARAVQIVLLMAMISLTCGIVGELVKVFGS